MSAVPHQAGFPDVPNVTIAAALDAARQGLKSLTDTADLDAELLLAHVLGCTRGTLYARSEQVLSSAQLAQFDKLIARRNGGEPVAYITGRREFWSLELQVTSATLIPRPETELLVELALQRIPEQATWRIADLGTGSGAIALALASERPGCHIMATDISAAALAVAHGNAEQLAISNVEFYLGGAQWCAPLQGTQFDMIVSNPPYISPDSPQLTTTGLLRFEPPLALLGGNGGLQHLHGIARHARAHLKPGAWLILEHGFDQGPQMLKLLTGMGYCNVVNHIDLAGHDRVTTAQHG